VKLEDIYSWNLYPLAKRAYECEVIHKATGQRIFKTFPCRSKGAALDAALDYMYENISYDGRIDAQGEFHEEI
jgi:hypothetical protein